MSLKTKLIIASCGPLVILLIVGLISIRTITQSSSTLERIFRENYDSVAAGLKMKNAVEEIDRSAEALVWGNGAGKSRIEPAVREFAAGLKFQQGNVTIPGEQELTNRLTQVWGDYRNDLQSFLQLSDMENTRRDFYRNRLIPASDRVADAAQQIIDINLNNMISVDGQVRQQAAETNRTVVLLVVAGVVLALILVLVVGPFIVRPISNLTRSVKEIKQGNLDLLVRARSRDEIGQLAAAFNEMTSSLREFRRSGRARLVRTQKATLSALNSLPDAIVICSPGGEIELANDTARKQFGITVGKNILADGNQKIGELFDRARREVRPIRPKSLDAAIQVFRDGEERFFQPEAVPILDEDRGFVGATLILSDVTVLRQINEAKSSLISTVSHELKTPLTSIRLATHALLNEKLGPLTPEQTELLAVAREDSERLHRIIEKLLDMGQLESGRSKVELAPVNTGQILVNIVQEMRPAFGDKGIDLVLDLPGTIPNILADKFRLEVVFKNLLNNALKHTPAGGQVSLSAREEDGRVVFEVLDTGEGIPKEYLPHIFEKFFRVPGYSHYGDSGLGLAIVKEIVEAHGSTVDVESNPGEGTRFTFAFPSQEHAASRPSPAEA